MEYLTLTPEERLVLATESLRGYETEHYRTTLVSPQQQGPQGNQRVEQLEELIAKVGAEVKALKKEIDSRSK